MLRKITIVKRILVLTIIPLSVILWLSVSKLIALNKQKTELHQVVELSELTTSVSQLISAIQREQSYSAGLIGSKGASFGNELRQARKQTDEALLGYKKLISTGVRSYSNSSIIHYRKLNQTES